VREDVRRFVATVPDALLRPVPDEPVPFSTPRAWVAFSRAIDAAQSHGVLDAVVGRALAFGRLSPQDAAVFCALAEETAAPLRPLAEYLHEPALLPAGESARWFVLDCIRQHLKGGLLPPLDAGVAERFLRALPDEHQLAVIADLVARWSELGADEALLALLERVSGLDREAPEAACGAAPDAAAQAA
jgi:hypothetical protein